MSIVPENPKNVWFFVEIATHVICLRFFFYFAAVVFAGIIFHCGSILLECFFHFARVVLALAFARALFPFFLGGFCLGEKIAWVEAFGNGSVECTSCGWIHPNAIAGCIAAFTDSFVGEIGSDDVLSDKTSRPFSILTGLLQNPSNVMLSINALFGIETKRIEIKCLPMPPATFWTRIAVPERSCIRAQVMVQSPLGI